MQRRGYLVDEQKPEFQFTLCCFVVKRISLANLTSEVIFFNEIVRVASSTNTCELTV